MIQIYNEKLRFVIILGSYSNLQDGLPIEPNYLLKY